MTNDKRENCESKCDTIERSIFRFPEKDTSNVGDTKKDCPCLSCYSTVTFISSHKDLSNILSYLDKIEGSSDYVSLLLIFFLKRFFFCA